VRGLKRIYKARSKNYNYFHSIKKETDKKKDLIESNKAYLKNIFENLIIGQIIKGKVIEITDRQAIIEFNSFRCFLHISEI
jgi:ribosomal protein S1